ncbi:MAG: class I SAM-dependent methyltransferase [Bacteroidota bacterium]
MTTNNDNQPSNFIKSIDAQRQKQVTALARLNEINTYCRELTDVDLPPLPAMQKIGSDSAQHFKNVMVHTFTELYNRFKLHPQSTVFDLGCGSGRMAYPFAQLLAEGGAYYGADVWQEGIELCQQRFNHPQMTFHHIPAQNNYYFDEFKSGVSNNFTLSFLPDADLDLIFAISVFTHLIEEDALAYLREFKRTLRPNGCAYITCFIIDQFFMDFVDAKDIRASFKEKAPGHYQAYKGQDFFAGFTRRKWEQLLATAGLELISFERGSWAQKLGARTFQDLLIVTHQRGIDEM